jgi:hypothetical protein
MCLLGHDLPLTRYLPCLCLCLGFVQITYITPLRLTILHFGQRRLTDGVTFIAVTSSKIYLSLGLLPWLAKPVAGLTDLALYST